jgi:hypothetical protein
MNRDPIRTGEQGRLRVQFTDAAFLPIEATSVTVDLFAPGLNPDTDTPTIAGLIPVHLGDGIFELTITGPSPGGSWIDRWTGNILGTVTISSLRFDIISSGFIASYPINGLGNNTLVEISLSSDIASLSGVELESPVSIVFTTTYTPLYSSVRKVKLDAGGMLGNLPDDTINLAILEASIEADVITFNKSVINNDLFIHAKRQYVTCLAAMGLAQNVLANGGVLKSKMLADFKVDYDTGILANLLNKLSNCISKWELQVQSGGGARTIKNPRMVIKGELDPDRPTTGRLWYGLSAGELPIGNNRFRLPGYRRYKTGWVTPATRGNNW